jgi:hypothetical protein
MYRRSSVIVAPDLWALGGSSAINSHNLPLKELDGSPSPQWSQAAMYAAVPVPGTSAAAA